MGFQFVPLECLFCTVPVITHLLHQALRKGLRCLPIHLNLCPTPTITRRANFQMAFYGMVFFRK